MQPAAALAEQPQEPSESSLFRPHIHVRFFEAPTLLDDCREDRDHRGVIEGLLAVSREPIEERLLARGIIDGKRLLALPIAHLEDDPSALTKQTQDGMVDPVDSDAQLLDLRVPDHA